MCNLMCSVSLGGNLYDSFGIPDDMIGKTSLISSQFSNRLHILVCLSWLDVD